MTLSEFKAWFEGYTEGFDGAPSEKQFKRIKAKVAEITGAPLTQTVFVEKYHDYWPQNPALFGGVTAYWVIPTAQRAFNAIMNNMAETNGYPDDQGQTVEWDSHAAMYAAGKADAVAEAA